MKDSFQEAYRSLNAQQQRAVDTIDGPLMVIAGPGTGKTQLLSTRAARIVSTGNVNASNILCLTYTEAGATEMCERLTRIMGTDGNDVAVFTFHSFGSSLINQYPEYFTTVRSLQPLDSLNRYRILESLLAKLPLRHQLAVRGDTQQFIRQHAVQEAIQEFKRAGLSADELRAVYVKNKASFTLLQPVLDDVFGSTLSAKRLPTIAASIAGIQPEGDSLAAILLTSMAQAVAESAEAGVTKPLGAWRDSHTVIKDGKRVLKSDAQSTVFSDTIALYEQYQEQLNNTGRYDYEDMIIWASTALQNNQDLLLDVAERYQYIMVDEYQDTNGAQNRLLANLLTANPLDAPNIMVVGDDDQAIMRFQGAEVSGMVGFAQTYQPQVIVLTDNYRSGQPILDASRQIMLLSDDRLEVALPELGLTKQLQAQHEPVKTAINHQVFGSPSLQYQAVSKHIQILLDKGVPPTEIAVISTRHAELAKFVPYLTTANIPSNYDYHENVLEQQDILDLLRLAQCVAALSHNPIRATALLPNVLAASYWQLPALAVYKIAAQAKVDKKTWLDTMLESDDRQWQAIAEWLIAAASQCQTSNFTQCFDVLIGKQVLPGTVLKSSPFLASIQLNSTEYVQLLSHLIRLRSAVLEARPSATGITDLLEVIQEYRMSGLHIVDSNPVLRGDINGVQVMSAHGSKGREFEHVILLSAVDTLWGAKARSQNQRVRLPENLPLYPNGDSDSDRLRLLYVAMTRAKSHILLTSYAANDEGKPVPPLSYIQFGDAGWWTAQPQTADPATAIATLESAWRPITRPPLRSLAEELQPLTKNFRLSASALRSYLDIRYSGPQACLEQSILGFPSAYTPASALGSAAHKSLEAAYKAFTNGLPLSNEQLLHTFDAILEASGLSEAELEPVKLHGHQFLPAFLADFSMRDFSRITATEEYASAVLPNSNVPVSGFIDAIAQTSQGIRVIDYKTGKAPQPDWNTKGLSDSKKVGLHFYRQQLLFYKLLLDSSQAASNTVTCAELIFVEPSENGDFIRLQITDFDTEELHRTEQLIAAVYAKIQAGDFPDTSHYDTTLQGILAFEDDIIAGI